MPTFSCRNKELRFRDFYEKVFPEIKKQREQTERFSRLGSRANWGLAARSEAEYNEILRDLTEKEVRRHTVNYSLFVSTCFSMVFLLIFRPMRNTCEILQLIHHRY